MRAFVALELPRAFADETAGLARQLEGCVEGRFIRRETYHVTLAFLGDVDDSRRVAAMDALDAAASGMEAPVLAGSGLGTFGKPRDATLWMGLEQDGGLMELASRLRSELRGRGVPFDGKRFRPHITLARRARLPQGELPRLSFPRRAAASRVTLFKSELSPQGAAYKPLYTVELQGPTRH